MNTNKREFQFTQILSITLAISFAMIAPPYSAALAMSKPFVPCVNPARIKVGTEVFYIRRPGRVDIRSINPGEVRDLCRAAEPLPVKGWVAGVQLGAILPEIENEMGKNGVPKGKHTNQIVVNYIAPTDRKDFQSLYKNVEILLKVLGVKQEDLPLQNGFYVWRKKGRPTISTKDFASLSDRGQYLYSNSVYISNDSELRSPTGEPAVIACQDYGDMEQDCRAMIWDGQTAFTITGLKAGGSISKELWKKYYKGFMQLRTFLLTPPAAEAPR